MIRIEDKCDPVPYYLIYHNLQSIVCYFFTKINGASFRIDPVDYRNKICDVTRDFAFQQGVIAKNDMFALHEDVISLTNHYRKNGYGSSINHEDIFWTFLTPSPLCDDFT